MRPALRIVVLAMAAALLAGCDQSSSGLWGNTEFDNYTQRLDKVTDSAGDANARNIALQTDHPHPAYAYDHRIPVSGEAAARSVYCLEHRGVGGSTTTTDSTTVATPGGAVTAGHSVSTPNNDCKY